MNRLFDAGAAVRSYDVSPDGRRFLINIPASSTARPQSPSCITGTDQRRLATREAKSTTTGP